MKNTKLIVVILIIFVLGILGYLLFIKNDDTKVQQRASDASKDALTQVSGSFKQGEKIPDVRLIDLDGNTHELSNFAGKAVIIDFWAGWCPFCIEEMPELQKAHQEYGNDLVIIGVHRTDTESVENGLKFAKERGVTYLLVSDSDGSLYRAAGSFGMPVAVFIDKEGVVTEIKSGPKTAEEIKQKVGELVADN